MVPSKRDEVRGAQAAAMTSREKSAAVNCRAGAQVANCHASGAHYGKKKVEKSKPRFRVNRIPEAGVKDPLSGAQDH